MVVLDIVSAEQVFRLKGIVVLDFWADWCKPCSQMNAVFEQLSSQFPNISFVKVEAEKVPDVAEKYEVAAVPFFVFLNDGAAVDSVEGANPAELTQKVMKHHQNAPKSTTSTPAGPVHANGQPPLEERLSKLVNFAPVMLFMKGVPEAPQCGFSRKIAEILKAEDIKFGSFDILSDEEVRNGLKKFSNWPTYPQLYIKGKLVGGLDIVKELQESGELKGMVPADEASTLNKRLETLVNSSPVMLFMKGVPEAPQCGFSRRIVEALEKDGIKFGSFDILSDEEVRNGLKKFSNWPTYPQLYIKGKLVGGLDIVKELQESGELKDMVQS